jgi:hypothetical protein
MKNAWSYTSTPPYDFRLRFLAKHVQYHILASVAVSWLVRKDNKRKVQVLTQFAMTQWNKST